MNVIKKEITSILSATLHPRNFVHGRSIANPPNPEIFINGHGYIGLPLSINDAEVIISKSKRSAFGKGEKTLVDTSVRRSWELDPSQFSLRSLEWTRMMKSILSSVCNGLQLSGGSENVTAELYKLLLYEEGAFFKPHRDSEKTPGMFGTLVVCLPSEHQGGDLVLSHNDGKHVFKTSPHSYFGMSFAAWYADVFHEIKPVTSGYRLVLTYNLLRRNGTPVRAPSPSMASHKDRLLPHLSQYSSCATKKGYPKYLVHKLEHQYTGTSLRFELLKGADRGQVQCLEQAARQLGFDLYFATMERTISSYDDQPEDESNYWSLKHIATLSGSQVDDIDEDEYRQWFLLDDDKILDPEVFNSEAYDAMREECFMGNDGTPGIYWYRDTALVLVPPPHKIEFLYNCSCQPLKVLSWMRQLRRSADSTPSAQTDLMELCRVALDFPEEDHWCRESRPMAKQVLHELALTVLQGDWLDLFDRAMSKVSSPMLPEVFQTLGRAMVGAVAVTDEEAIIARIEKALETATTFKSKYEALKQIQSGFLKAPAGGSRGTESAFDLWLTISAKVVEQSKLMDKADGVALADAIRTWEPKSVKEWAIPRVQSSSAAVKFAFVTRLMSDDAVTDTKISEVDRREYSKLVLTHLWENLRLKSLLNHDDKCGVNSTVVDDYADDSSSTTSIDEDNLYENSTLTGTDLGNLILHTIDNGILTENEIQQHLAAAVTEADEDTCTHTLLPFVKLILEQKVSCYKLDKTNGRPNPASISFVTKVLEHYIRTYVGEEPDRPATWTQPTGSCHNTPCMDCRAANAFLADPKHQFGYFYCSKARREHLDQTFNIPNAPYDVETNLDKKPYYWMIAKMDTWFEHEAWKARREKVETLMQAGPLKSYLGDAADDILSLHADVVEEGPSEADGDDMSLE